MSETTLSIVIPANNEEESLPILIEEIASLEFENCRLEEVIVVDDGSVDGTADALERLALRYDWLEAVTHPERRGQTVALATGFAVARGELVATLDADLQNDPADIPHLVAILVESEADMVTGVRQRRRDSPWKRIQSLIGNGVRNWITGDRIADTGCTLRVSKRGAVDNLLEFDGAHRFVPTLVRIRGGRVLEQPVRHRPRRFGTSKYGAWNRAIGGLIDCFAVRRLRRSSALPGTEERN